MKERKLIEALNAIADLAEEQGSAAIYALAANAVRQWGTPLDSQRGLFQTELEEVRL